MSSDETTATGESTKTYEIGLVDIALLVSFLMALVVWLWKRKKTEASTDTYTIKPLLQKQVSKQTSFTDHSFITKMKNSQKQIAIFYGSQTGTAEEFATRLAKDAQRYGLKGTVLDPEECDPDDIPRLKDPEEFEKTLAVFVMATYGEGDPTDNAQGLYEYLQGEPDLEGLNYTVFGLGNKTYEHFNAMGRFVDKRIKELGGVNVHPLGEGDDDANIEEDFVKWRECLWPAVCSFFEVDMDANRVKRSLSVMTEREFELQTHTNLAPEKVFIGEISKLGAFEQQRGPFDAKNPFLAPVFVNKELHNGGERSCMHIELDITGSNIRYSSGDHVGVYPVNDPELVEELGKILNIDLDTVFSLKNMDPDARKASPFPCPTTFRTALSHYVDIASVVKTHVLAELVAYAGKEEDREILENMIGQTEEAKNKYSEWMQKDHRHIVSVLKDLPSLRPPIDLLLEFLPRLQCRYYSISSSSKVFPNSIHVTAVVVDWMTRIGRRQKGVATTWLQKKLPENGDTPRVPIFVRQTTFRLPMKHSTPCIMIGPGTGLAPFRGFLQERSFYKNKKVDVGETILYFGCRKKSEDYIYRTELADLVADGTITSLHVAFSRDQPKKIYVTHLMHDTLDEVWKVLGNGGHVYVCGDARNMARDVHAALLQAAQVKGQMTENEAVDFLRKLSNTNKYCVDVWS